MKYNRHLLFLSTAFNVLIRGALQVTPAEFTGHEEIVRLQRHKREDSSLEINFEFRKQRYCYDEDEHTFQRLHFPDKVRS